MSLPTEDEEYQKMIEGLAHAAESARRIAFLRGDDRWIKISNGMEATKEFCRALMAARVDAALGFRKEPLQ